jgi:hypothetical protein
MTTRNKTAGQQRHPEVLLPCRSSGEDCVTSRPSEQTVRSYLFQKGLYDGTHAFIEVDPLTALAFLSKLHDVLESYIGGPVTEPSLKVAF